MLWTNSEITDDYSFPPQTVNLDLSKYKGVMILTIFTNKSSVERRNYKYFTDFIPVGFTGTIGGAIDLIVSRKVTVNNNGIVFNDGYTIGELNDQSSGNKNNTYGIPCQIYGIR